MGGLLFALLLCGPAAAQGALKQIESYYAKMAAAYSRKDTGAFLTNFAPVVSSENFANGRADHAQLTQGLDGLFNTSERLSMHYRVQSFQEGDRTAIAIVRSTRLILQQKDGRREIREGTTEIRHTWKLIQGRWKIIDIYRLGRPAYGRRANSPYYWI